MGYPHLGWHLPMSLNAQPVLERDSRVSLLFRVWPDHWHLLGLQRQARADTCMESPLEDDHIVAMIELHCEASKHPISWMSQNHRAPVPLHVWSPLQSKSSSSHQRLKCKPHLVWTQLLWRHSNKPVAVHGDHLVLRLLGHLSWRPFFCLIVFCWGIFCSFSSTSFTIFII